MIGLSSPRANRAWIRERKKKRRADYKNRCHKREREREERGAQTSSPPQIPPCTNDYFRSFFTQSPYRAFRINLIHRSTGSGVICASIIIRLTLCMIEEKFRYWFGAPVLVNNSPISGHRAELSVNLYIQRRQLTFVTAKKILSSGVQKQRAWLEYPVSRVTATRPEIWGGFFRQR